MINEHSVKELKANLRGGMIEPQDSGYDEACKVYNGMIHKKPRLIARCADVADVISSVNFARVPENIICFWLSAVADITPEAWGFAMTG